MTQRISTIIGLVAAALLLAVLVGVVGLLYARPVTAQSSTSVTNSRQVSVTGHGEVKGTPDTATVQIGVETDAANAKDALGQNTTQAQAIQEQLVNLGIDTKDIQTSNFSINPTYSNDNQQVTGYHVNNIVNVTIRNLDQAGNLLDQVVQAGANSIYGVNFSVDQPQALLSQARAQAIADAKARASELAKASGATVGEVLVINENVGAQVLPIAARADMAAANVPLQAGEQTYSVDVQVTFALQ